LWVEFKNKFTVKTAYFKAYMKVNFSTCKFLKQVENRGGDDLDFLIKPRRIARSVLF
jgi:hypothetical protein